VASFPYIRTVWLIAGLLLASTSTVCAGSGDVTLADNVRIHYLDEGAGNDGPTLLLIPGWSMDAAIWTPQIAEFSRTHRVVAIDPRSQGRSSKPDAGNTPRGRAVDIEAVMEQLALDHVVLVGWSQGVQDVAAYVDRFGTRRIAGLVLVDSPVSSGAAGITENPQAARLTFERLSLYAAHPRDYLQGMLQAIFLAPTPEPEQQRRLQTALQMPVSNGVAMLTQDLYGEDLRQALRKFDRPTLVVAASGSPELAAQEAMAAQLDRATLVRIDHAGHGVFADQPQQFNAALRAFLSDLDP